LRIEKKLSKGNRDGHTLWEHKKQHEEREGTNQEQKGAPPSSSWRGSRSSRSCSPGACSSPAGSASRSPARAHRVRARPRTHTHRSISTSRGSPARKKVSGQRFGALARSLAVERSRSTLRTYPEPGLVEVGLVVAGDDLLDEVARRGEVAALAQEQRGPVPAAATAASPAPGGAGALAGIEDGVEVAVDPVVVAVHRRRDRGE
jgi:hypothetical protein